MNIKYLCLNLKHAHERRQHCDKQFAEAGIHAQYVNGFNGKKLGLAHPVLIRGKIGCYLSFLKVYEEIARNDYGTTVIFEDDVVLHHNFKNKLERALPVLPDDWDMAFIGWRPWFNDFNGLKSKRVGEMFVEGETNAWLQFNGGGYWGNHAQVINGAKGANRLMEILATMNEPCDVQISSAIIRHELKGYFLEKPIVEIVGGAFKSQIEEW